MANLQLRLTYDGSTVTRTVTSLDEASALWCEMRDRDGLGASESPLVEVTDGPLTVVARISYNGRVWAPDGSLIREACSAPPEERTDKAWIACDESCLGWAVFEVDAQRRAEIQRCDQCDRFESDDEARSHVLRLAVASMGLRDFERWAEAIRHAELDAIAELREVRRG